MKMASIKFFSSSLISQMKKKTRMRWKVSMKSLKEKAQKMAMMQVLEKIIARLAKMGSRRLTKLSKRREERRMNSKSKLGFSSQLATEMLIKMSSYQFTTMAWYTTED